MSRIIFVGDVHGMKNELQQLVEKLSPGKEDTLIFLGDLLDKGPDSPGVVKFVRSLKDQTNLVLIKGNHERKHERFRHKIANDKISDAHQIKGSKEIAGITKELLQEDIDFLETSVIYYQIGKYLALHAGIPGNMRELPSLFPKTGKEQRWLELLTFTRYVGYNTGRMVPLGQEDDDDPFWAEVYDGRFGRVVFGHQPWRDGVHWFDHAIGIDTAAVHGHELTALVVENEIESIVTVTCQKFAEYYQFYKDQEK